MLRYHPKYAETDPDSPQAWGSCDRCGFVWNLNQLTWQYDYRGSAVLQNIRLLVCRKCLDVPQPQLTPNVLSPDPPPFFNARPEPYVVDETNWLATEDGDIIETQSSADLTPSLPNPFQSAGVCQLASNVTYLSGSVGAIYLDLFVGNPATSGVSVLAAITGSATRTDIGSSLTTSAGVAQNTSPLSITSSASSQTNVNYVGLYAAASGGSVLAAAPVSCSPSITAGASVQFDSQALRIRLS